MPVALARHWWSLVIRGMVAVLAGVLTFFVPGITVAGLVILFGAYALVDGIVSLVALIRSKGGDRWGSLLLEGIAGIVAGLITFFMPGITALALVYIIAAWSLVTGVFEIVAAIRLRKVIRGEWLLLLSGIVSIILGILFSIAPAAAALVIALWFGAYAVVFGVLLIALGFRLRSVEHGAPGASIPLPSH